MSVEAIGIVVKAAASRLVGTMWLKVVFGVIAVSGLFLKGGLWAFELGYLTKYGLTTEFFNRAIGDSEYLKLIFSLKVLPLLIKLSLVWLVVSLMVFIQPIAKAFLLFVADCIGNWLSTTPKLEWIRNWLRGRPVRTSKAFSESLQKAQKLSLYLLSVDYFALIVLWGLVKGALYFMEEGQKIAEDQLNTFISDGVCKDFFDNNGCYTLTEPASHESQSVESKSYEGLLIAMTAESWAMYTKNGLVVRPRIPGLEIHRAVNITLPSKE